MLLFNRLSLVVYIYTHTHIVQQLYTVHILLSMQTVGSNYFTVISLSTKERFVFVIVRLQDVFVFALLLFDPVNDFVTPLVPQFGNR